MADVHFVAATRTPPGMARPAVDSVDLHVRDGELVVLGGAPGSGKSTLLRMLAGLEPLDSGRVAVGGARLSAAAGPAVDGQRVSLMNEDFGLMPNLTLFGNIALPLLLHGAPDHTVGAAVVQAAGACGLDAFLSRYPLDLPFETRLRAALARAVVRRPDVVCLDEPLAGPDAHAAGDCTSVIREIQRALRVTMIYATCRSADALALADRVGVLHDGRVQQIGRPRAVLKRPDTVAAARFAGPALIGLLAAPVEAGVARIGSLAVALTPSQRAALSCELVLVGLNPARLRLVRAGPGIDATVVRVRRAPRGHAVSTVATVDSVAFPLEIARVAGPPPAVGDRALIGVDPGQCIFYDPHTGRRLSD